MLGAERLDLLDNRVEPRLELCQSDVSAHGGETYIVEHAAQFLSRVGAIARELDCSIACLGNLPERAGKVARGVLPQCVELDR